MEPKTLTETLKQDEHLNDSKGVFVTRDDLYLARGAAPKTWTVFATKAHRFPTVKEAESLIRRFPELRGAVVA